MGSLVMAAVRPTPEEPLPVVYTARGEMLHTYRSSWLLATPGSPAGWQPRRWHRPAQGGAQDQRL